jgi:hypothetical protein
LDDQPYSAGHVVIVLDFAVGTEKDRELLRFNIMRSSCNYDFMVLLYMHFNILFLKIICFIEVLERQFGGNITVPDKVLVIIVVYVLLVLYLPILY